MGVEGVLITQSKQTRDGTDVDDSPDRDGYGLRGNKLSRKSSGGTGPPIHAQRQERGAGKRYVCFMDNKEGSD